MAAWMEGWRDGRGDVVLGIIEKGNGLLRLGSTKLCIINFPLQAPKWVYFHKIE